MYFALIFYPLSYPFSVNPEFPLSCPNWWLFFACFTISSLKDKVYDLIFSFLWEEDFACFSWQSTLLLKRVLLFYVTLLSFSVRKILLKQIFFWMWKWRKMCYFLLFLCPRIVIITYNHVPMQMLFMLGNSSLCVKIKINSKTESKEILEKK